ncbi:MAG: LysM peptidoglycan-binding domain-containing protein [Chloroflexi bacterium]|nr:LysM peptidoglycan-binding domain-containing protein [Chloroflexota bacterium]
MQSTGAIRIHRVARNDTVSALAQRYRISPQTIIWANGIADPDRIAIGGELIILPVSGILYHASPGDSPERVGAFLGIDPGAIAHWNGLPVGETLVRPAALVIPGGRPATASSGRDRTAAEIVPTQVSARVPRPTPSPVRPSEVGSVSAALTVVEVARAALPVPVVEPRVVEHLVQPGESLAAIAAQFGVRTDTIVHANGMTVEDADALMIGQKILVPRVDGVLHLVREGETVRSIAARSGIAPLAVIEANRLREPYVVVPNQRLIIPGVSISPARRSPSPPSEYVIQPGDSIVSIAERFGVDTRTLVRKNNLPPSGLIVPGMKIELPGPTDLAAPPREAVREVPPVPASRAPNPLQVAVSILRPLVPVPAAAIAPAPGAPSVVRIAREYLGFAYIWGGHSPRSGFDCTGFTWFVFDRAGRALPNHDLWGQVQSGDRVERKALQPGDLVFFTDTYVPGLSHVGIYLSGGDFIHAGSERTGVIISSMADEYWSARYYGATRPA